MLTDKTKGYLPMKKECYSHRAVRHSMSKCVDGMARTNEMKCFWSMLTRGYYGTFHLIPREHLERYVVGFQHRHNERPNGTIDQVSKLARCLDDKQLTCADLVAPGVRANKIKEMV